MLFTVTKNVQEFIVRMCEQMGTFILTQLVFLPWDECRAAAPSLTDVMPAHWDEN